MGPDYNTGLSVILGRPLCFYGRPRTSTFERGGRDENKDVPGRLEMCGQERWYQKKDDEDGSVLQKPGISMVGFLPWEKFKNIKIRNFILSF